MITVIAFGLLAMSACLALQVSSVFAARYFAQTSKQPFGPKPLRGIFRQFSILMIVLMIGNIVQVAFWASKRASIRALTSGPLRSLASSVTTSVMLPPELGLASVA